MSPTPRTPDISEITVDREAMTLRAAFEDGTSGEISLMELRLNCPCATCRAARQNGRAVWPPPGRDADLELRDAQFVGAWGLGIQWGDGHATGIYPFEELHAWIASGEPPFRPDSGLGN